MVCLIGARLCQPSSIPSVDRLSSGTPRALGLATYVRDPWARSARLGYRLRKIWHQRRRGAVRIEDPESAITKIVD